VAERVCVAQIGAPHGVRGEVRLWVFTEDPAAIAQFGPLQSEDGGRSFEIAALRPAKDHFVARLKGVDDRNAAEALTNVKLYVARDQLPAADDDDTFYHADLIGLAAVSADGETFGSVVGVHNFGAGDLLELKPPKGRTVMIPFTAACVPEVDIVGGRVVVAPPEGTFDTGGEKPDDEPA
jgi:16S rRNA processing protein RimM